jgi:Oxidoreductase-like protein, N-terminal
MRSRAGTVCTESNIDEANARAENGQMPEPPPIPPREPSMDECCRSGCMVCVFDLFEDELVRYEAALQAWRERQGVVDTK